MRIGALVLAGAVAVVLLARAGRALATPVGAALFFLAGLLVATLRLDARDTLSEQPGRLDGGPVLLEGRVAEALEPGEDADAMLLDVTGSATVAGRALTSASARVRVRLPRGPGAAPLPWPRDQVRVWARLRPGPAALAPSMRSRRLAVRRGVMLAGAALSPQAWTVISRPGWSATLLGPAEALRRRLGGVLGAMSAPPLVAAMSLGDYAELDRGEAMELHDGGFAHLGSIYGLYLAAMVGLAFIALSRLLLSRKWAALSALLLLGFGVWLAGAPPALLRVGCTLFFLLLPPLLRRPADPLSQLAAAALVCVAIDPACLGDVAFQLPFAATAACFRVAPALRRGLERLRLPRPLRAAGALLLTSVALSLGMMPLWARLFERVSLASFALHVLALPLAELAAVSGALGAALGQLSLYLGWPLVTLAHWSADQVLALARLAAALAPALGRVPTPTVPECLLFYTGVSLLCAAPGSGSRRMPLLGGLALAALALSVGTGVLRNRPDGLLHAVVVPTTEGRGVIFQAPGGELLVVDEGPPVAGFDLGDRAVVGWLKLHRKARVEVLCVLDGRRWETARDLARQIPVSALWWNGPSQEVPEALRRALPGAAVLSLSETATLALGTAKVRLAGGLRVSLGRRTLALALGTGEAGAPADALIAGEDALAEAEQVQAARAARSGLAEAGEGAHPRRDPQLVLALPYRPHAARRAPRSAAEPWRTDVNGLIRLSTDGGSLEVEPFLSGELAEERRKDLQAP